MKSHILVLTLIVALVATSFATTTEPSSSSSATESSSEASSSSSPASSSSEAPESSSEASSSSSPASSSSEAPESSSEASSSSSPASSSSAPPESTSSSTEAPSSTTPVPSASDLANHANEIRVQIIRGLIGVTNIVKRRILTDAAVQLQQTQANAAVLNQYKNQVQSNFEIRINQQQQALTTTWNNWSNLAKNNIRILSRGNQTKIDNNNKIINDLIEKYNEQLTDCIEQTNEANQNYQDDVQNSVNQYNTVINDLGAATDPCLAGDNSIASGNSCSNNLRPSLNQLRNAPGDFTRLVQQGSTTLAYSFGSNSCFTSILTDYNTEAVSTWNSIYYSLIRSG